MSRVIKAPYAKLNSDNKIRISVMQPEDLPGAFVASNLNSDEVDEVPHEKKVEIILAKAHEEANAVRSKAEYEADVIIEDAKAEADRYARAAMQEAQEEGYSKGYNEGYKKGANEAQQLIQQAENEAEAAKRELERIQEELEPKAVKLVSEICEKLIGSSVQINPEVILFVIHNGLSHLQKLSTVNVRVSVDDYETVASNKQDIIDQIDSTAQLEIIRDLSLSIGDCIIETPLGDLDCSLGMQLKGLIRDLNLIFENR